MRKLLKALRRRAADGFRLTHREAVTLEAVMERIRNALRENRGIRLTKEELRVLGVYGLGTRIDDTPNEEP